MLWNMFLSWAFKTYNKFIAQLSKRKTDTVCAAIAQVKGKSLKLKKRCKLFQAH